MDTKTWADFKVKSTFCTGTSRIRIKLFNRLYNILYRIVLWIVLSIRLWKFLFKCLLEGMKILFYSPDKVWPPMKFYFLQILACLAQLVCFPATIFVFFRKAAVAFSAFYNKNTKSVGLSDASWHFAINLKSAIIYNNLLKVLWESHFISNSVKKWLPVTSLIFHTKCANVTEIKNYWVQPLIKRKSKWIDHMTLFPVSEMGFCFLT